MFWSPEPLQLKQAKQLSHLKLRFRGWFEGRRKLWQFIVGTIESTVTSRGVSPLETVEIAINKEYPGKKEGDGAWPEVSDSFPELRQVKLCINDSYWTDFSDSPAEWLRLVFPSIPESNLTVSTFNSSST